MSGCDKPRTVKLLCPSLSKIVTFAARDEEKLDLGSIAKAFGLDPSTLKLNGHFISRGVDFVSSSVTWRSLLNFFSVKGLSTGKHDPDALIVDGKLSKSRTKRGHEDGAGVEDRKSEFNLVKENKKLRGINSGYEDVDGLKRKQISKDTSLLKKFKINNTGSVEERGDDFESNVTNGKVRCRPSPSATRTIGHMKRTREDDTLTAAPSKKAFWS